MAKIYPIGVQNFAKLREDGYTYVDKTAYIEKLVGSGKEFIEFAMLTGVSRFGKLSIFSDLNNLNDISLTFSQCYLSCNETDGFLYKG